MLVLLLGELESTELERPTEGKGEGSREDSAGGDMLSSKLETGRMEAILLGGPGGPFGASEVEGRLGRASG